MRPRDQAIHALAILVAVVALAAMFWRIRRGVDTTDEGFYAALPARIAMGDRPYVDELNVALNAGLLVYPFVKLHMLVRGFTGIILFLRILYLLFFAATGYTAFRAAMTRLPFPMALLVGAACVGYLPYGLAGLSYNTLGAGLIAIGLFVNGVALLSPPENPPKFWRDAFFWGGVAHGAGAFAYPTLLTALVFAGLGILAFARPRIASFARYVAGGLAFGLVMVPVFISAGGSNLRLMMTYSGADTPANIGGPSKLEILRLTFTQWTTEHPEFWKHAAIIGVLALLVRRFPTILGVAIVYVPLLVRVPVEGIYASLHYVITFALYAPIFAAALRDRKSALVVFCALWLPSFIAGVTTVISSTQGARAAGVGMFAGAIVSGLLLAMWIRETSQRWAWSFLRPFAVLAPAAFVVAMVQYNFADDNYYREGKVNELTTRITDGPYKGILTTPGKRELFQNVLADTRQYRSSRMLFYYDFPSGYLFAERPPNMASVWIFPHIQSRARLEAKFFLERASVGEYVYRFYGTASNHGSAVDAAVARHCELVAQRDGYAIYVVRTLP